MYHISTPAEATGPSTSTNGLSQRKDPSQPKPTDKRDALVAHLPHAASDSPLFYPMRGNHNCGEKSCSASASDTML